jgi:hypothetical protein
MYSLLVLCHYVYCCLLQSVHCLSVPHNVPSTGSVSLSQLLFSKFRPLSVSTSHCTVGWFCVTMSIAVFYSLSTVCQYITQYRLLVLLTMSTAVFYRLSTVCQYLTMNRLLVLCHYVHCCLLQSVQCLSVPHNVPSAGSASLSQLLSSTVRPLSVSTSQCTVCWFCVTMYNAVFYSPSNVCQYLTMYRLLILCHYVQCCLLQSVHCLSVPQNVPFVGSVSLCPLLSSKVCTKSIIT